MAGDSGGLFEETGVGAWRCVAFKPWRSAGIVHGFLGSDADFGRTKCALQAEDLRRATGARAICLLEQVHGTEIVDSRFGPWPEKEPAGDGILVNLAAREGRCFGLRTADCAPLLLRAGTLMVMVHAGWRGLAGGIIERAVALLRAEAGGAALEVVLGPCAGADAYEVGPEVLAAIGETAHYRPGAEGRYLLSIPDTIEKRLQAAAAGDQDFWYCNICTINDTRHHSFRRDGAASGRNLGFVLS